MHRRVGVVDVGLEHRQLPTQDVELRVVVVENLGVAEQLRRGVVGRRDAEGRVLVADWGPWAGGGMVSPELTREYAGRGVALLEPGAAVAALLREIAAGEDVQVIFQ